MPATAPMNLHAPRCYSVMNVVGSGYGLALCALAACWLLLFVELHTEWSINAQYSYGYVVPLLGLALIWGRWRERPNASPGKTTWLFVVFVAALLLLALPMRLVSQANPEWRLLYWIHGLQVVLLSCCLCYYLGGWRWSLYFLPPLVFMLVAVPWPMAWEQKIIQGLMRFVAGLTVVVADGLGIPAVQHGNLVEVGAGLVGIDEACSGVRSLQAALMISIFLGEMHRFSFGRRLWLLSCSLLLVLIANVGRTGFLVWAAAHYGLRQMEAWHDIAGNIVMLSVLFGLMLLTYQMKRRIRRPELSRVQLLSTPAAVPRWIGLGTIGWLGATTALSEGWYRAHESNLLANPQWSVAWPSQSTNFKKSEVPDRWLQILRCSDSEAASWQDDSGNLWSGFFLRWPPEKNSAQLAKGHSPDICLPAAGARLLRDAGPVTLPTQGLQIPFRHEVFESGAGPFHVFYCLWSDRISNEETALREDGSEASRLEAVLAGRRNLGQQVLELVLQGPDSEDGALATLKKQLPSLIRCVPSQK